MEIAETNSSSFGSLEYPATKADLFLLLDTLDELDLPYMLAQGTAPDDIATDLPARVEQSGKNGMLSTWFPQVTVLKHPAILAFLSHGGSNSAMESMMCGVPMRESYLRCYGDITACSEPSGGILRERESRC